MFFINIIQLEDCSLLECDMSLLGKWFPLFQMNMLSSSSMVHGPAMQCHIPEDQNFLLHCFINLKSCIIEVNLLYARYFLSAVSCYITVKCPSNVSFMGQWI